MTAHQQDPSVTTAAPLLRTVRFWPLLLGLFLIVVYFRLDAVFHYGARFGPNLVHVAQQEWAFWLTHLLLVLPGVALVSFGLAPAMMGVVRQTHASFEELPPRQWWAAAATFGVIVFALAHIGRALFLDDLPLTDDENSVIFGARMLVEGDVSVPTLTPEGAYTDLFTYARGGRVSSLDYPGGLFFMALAIGTGLGSIWYALFAALSGVAVVGAATRLTDWRGGLFAGLVWVSSPMVFALSMTMHSAVLSRGAVALALYFAARLVSPRPDESPARSAVGLGAFTGLAFLGRPIEVGALLLPLGLLVLLRAVRNQPGYRRHVAFALAGLVPALVLFGAYNQAVTGHFYLQARFGEGVQSAYGIAGVSVWDRLAMNLGFETLMLSIWFLGPLGMVLAWLGVRRREPVTIALASGVGLALMIALAHHYTGIHAVGPIHYSEAAVLLTILAAIGMRELFVWLSDRGIARAGPALGLVMMTLVAYGCFNLTYGGALQEQAEVQRTPFLAVSEAGLHHAVVLARPPAELAERHRTGSWVLQFPHPDPYLRDDVIFARWDADVAALRARFPDRAFYRLHYPSTGPPVVIEPVAP